MLSFDSDILLKPISDSYLFVMLYVFHPVDNFSTE